MLTALRKMIRAVPTPPLSARLLSGTDSLWDRFDAGVDRWDGSLDFRGTRRPGITSLVKHELLELCMDRNLLDTVEGTGANGNILKKDLVAALRNSPFSYEDGQSSLGATPNQITELTPAALGVGGVDEAVQQLNDRVWLPIVCPDAARRLGMTPPKGIILYGPPGCGKSLLAVRFANCLSRVPPRIVKGPELLSPFVGSTEESVRELFEPVEDEDMFSHDGVTGGEWYGSAVPRNVIVDGKSFPVAQCRARASQQQPTDASIVILDEAETLLNRRGGSTQTQHTDRVVAQMLAMLDGADDKQRSTGTAANANTSDRHHLLIATTNRLQDLDPAITRPGRFEVALHIPAPSRVGRLEILVFETKNAREAGALADDIGAVLERCAEATEGFSGADLAGLVRVAKSIALKREVKKMVSMAQVSLHVEEEEELGDGQGNDRGDEALLVQDDFVRALESVRQNRKAAEKELSTTTNSVGETRSELQAVMRMMREIAGQDDPFGNSSWSWEPLEHG